MRDLKASRLLLGLVALGLAGCASSSTSNSASSSYYEPKPNLGLYKELLVHYHDSGQYEKAMGQAVQPALDYLRQRAEHGTAKLAVVFDIDETLVSNFPYLKRTSFSETPIGFEDWASKDRTPVLAASAKLYHEAQALGYRIVLITGRSQKLLPDTLGDLRHAGYTGWQGLYLRPLDYHDESIIPFKSGVRKKIQAEGYTVVLSIGDQWSDLEGGAAERVFKLPNPWYYIP